MKVWHLSSNRWNSAITEYALSAARSLAMQGATTLFSPLAGSPAERRARDAGLEVEPLNEFGVGAAHEARRIGAKFAPDHIVVYGGQESFLSRFLAAKGKKVRFRGHEVPGGALGRVRMKMALAPFDRVIAPSVFVAEALRNARVHVVPLGCDEARYRRRDDFLLPAKRPEVVVLGRLDPVKGHAAILRIMAQVWRAWTDAATKPVLHIVGEAANISESEVRRLVAKHGAEADTKLTFARVEDVPKLMGEAALGVVPSLGSEIIARVAEEFLLCGTPVVVSGVGSLDEVLFSDAGASYRGRSVTEAAQIVTAWVEKSVHEGDGAKSVRARRAKALFSLEAMGQSLREVIGSS